MILLAGCGFDSSVGAMIDATPADEMVGGTPDMRVDPFCDPQDPALVACYAFEDTTEDASGHALHATMTNVSFVTGKVGKAMQFGLDSAADVADSTLIDVAAITVEAWVYPFVLPGPGGRAGIADMEGQWGLFLHEPTGRVQCTMLGGPSMQIDAFVEPNKWTHVACTYDTGVTTMFVRGVQTAQMAGGGALATGGTTGFSIGANNPPGSGSRITGLVDQMRIYSRARTAAEICADAQCQ
jgi:Concanavalin A-like lectin/glucanases superfamily